jgi:hypothetical protein
MKASHPPFPFDQQGLVALFVLSAILRRPGRPEHSPGARRANSLRDLAREPPGPTSTELCVQEGAVGTLAQGFRLDYQVSEEHLPS